MFETREKLADEIGTLLEGIRAQAEGRYACVMEPKGILFESPEAFGHDVWALRHILEERRGALFSIPTALASGEPMEDVFEGWDHDELFLAFVNGRVTLIVACPKAEPLKEQAMKPLRVLVDRLLRYDPTWRMDSKGRGFFFGRAKLDLVVVGRSQD